MISNTNAMNNNNQQHVQYHFHTSPPNMVQQPINSHGSIVYPNQQPSMPFVDNYQPIPSSPSRPYRKMSLSSDHSSTPYYMRAVPSPPSSGMPQLLKANSHNAITSFFEYNSNAFPQQNATTPLNLFNSQPSPNSSRRSSSSSISDFEGEQYADIAPSSYLKRIAPQTRPILQKSSSLSTIVPKGIQKKKDLGFQPSTVIQTNAHFSSLVASNGIPNLNQLHNNPLAQVQDQSIPDDHNKPTNFERPVFMKSYSQGHILSSRGELPSLSQLFGNQFVEETKPKIVPGFTYPPLSK